MPLPLTLGTVEVGIAVMGSLGLEVVGGGVVDPAARARTGGASMAGLMVTVSGRGPRAQTSGHPSNWPSHTTPHSGQAHAVSPALIG